MRDTLEVADVFRDGKPHFLAQFGCMLRTEQRQVLRAVTRCRTAALGGHVQQCDDCGHQQIQYNSCRNRHCPKCQAMARAAWLEKRESELLSVPYFHVVFTLPHELAPLTPQPSKPAADDVIPTEEGDQTQQSCPVCPVCERGKLLIVELVDPTVPLRPRRPHMLTPREAFAKWFDTS